MALATSRFGQGIHSQLELVVREMIDVLVDTLARREREPDCGQGPVTVAVLFRVRDSMSQVVSRVRHESTGNA